MRFEWDERKASLNRKKHGISFEMATRAFMDPKRLIRYDEEHSTAEEDRFIVIGRVEAFLVLFVAFTDRFGKTRIISARPAEPCEEELYYENYDA